jgi:hypothetical protein
LSAAETVPAPSSVNPVLGGTGTASAALATPAGASTNAKAIASTPTAERRSRREERAAIIFHTSDNGWGNDSGELAERWKR